MADALTDPESLRLLSARTTMTDPSAASGAKLDAALADIGWLDMLDEMPDTAIPFGVPPAWRDRRTRPRAERRVRAAGGAPGGSHCVAGGSWWCGGDHTYVAIDGGATDTSCARRADHCLGRP